MTGCVSDVVSGYYPVLNGGMWKRPLAFLVLFQGVDFISLDVLVGEEGNWGGGDLFPASIVPFFGLRDSNTSFPAAKKMVWTEWHLLACRDMSSALRGRVPLKMSRLSTSVPLKIDVLWRGRGGVSSPNYFRSRL